MSALDSPPMLNISTSQMFAMLVTQVFDDLLHSIEAHIMIVTTLVIVVTVTLIWRRSSRRGKDHGKLFLFERESICVFMLEGSQHLYYLYCFERT